MTPEERATKSVDYLLRVDALASPDYRPEIEAEIARAIKEALDVEREACAQVVEGAGSIDAGDLNSEVAERIALRIRNRAK